MASRSFGPPGAHASSVSGTIGKDELRQRFRAMRASLPAEQSAAKSRRAQEHILDLRHWREAQTVLLYVGCRGETATDLLLQSAWQEQKTVLLPRCLPATPGEMELACVRSQHDLAPGLYSIPEPDPTTCSPVEPERVDLIVVPALAFDRRGFRLGQGGGYYDRLLVSQPYTKSLAIGLAFDFQVVRSLPVDGWDRPVAAVASDKELIWT
ncbi:5-formyltetrahydrofolate cyclo-ligase [Oceanidesulfovibrio marinus]|uniref:5-formyltetrahydrofolate cyclo-ligase n=1 Tax=Oceanidesulfovibrio marinus TaxID=370038 RepID=A0ABX6NIK1_9BACT|nr:5-formyltetrahydrofolate cyclo-ligase [Oceanidesulfovibrio marinus]QJT10414.1 5-formyltetrahydrofolate cyclo-ligase [Oceanidesulfovibrio marinus]